MEGTEKDLEKEIEKAIADSNIRAWGLGAGGIIYILVILALLYVLKIIIA